jgi:hypothetical protein
MASLRTRTRKDGSVRVADVIEVHWRDGVVDPTTFQCCNEREEPNVTAVRPSPPTHYVHHGSSTPRPSWMRTPP